MNNLKNEIEKINKGCRTLICHGTWATTDRCGDYKTDGEVILCPSCQSKKQGIILGAKMMIEKFKLQFGKLKLKFSPDMSEEDMEDVGDIITGELTNLKELNNWLENLK